MLGSLPVGVGRKGLLKPVSLLLKGDMRSSLMIKHTQESVDARPGSNT